MLMMYYGAYPFPHGDLFPGTAEKISAVKEVQNLHVTDTGCLWKLAECNESGDIVVTSQTPVGRYQWVFRDQEMSCCTEVNNEQFTFPDLQQNSDGKRSEQQEFAAKMNKSVERLEELLGTKLKMDAIQDEDISDTLDEIRGYILKRPKNFRRSALTKAMSSGSVVPEVSEINLASVPTAVGLASGLDEHMRSVTLNQTIALQVMNINKKTYRFGFKVGIVYAGEGIEDQNSILATQMESTTPHFREFLHGVGWPVYLPTHIGYDGGLHLTASSNGTSSVYYADYGNETMFHVSPLFPFDSQNDQQLLKKRHIGNDHVHIVWNENRKFYDPGTISSQFNQCHVIIHPLTSKGLFAVSVVHKPELKWFGPLCGTVVLDKRALPVLARATVQSAMKFIYRNINSQEWKVPQQEIEAALATLIDDQKAYDHNRATSLSMLMPTVVDLRHLLHDEDEPLPALLRSNKSASQLSRHRKAPEVRRSVPIGTRFEFDDVPERLFPE